MEKRPRKRKRKLSKSEISEILKVIKPESDVKSLDSLFLSLFPHVDDTDDAPKDLHVVSPPNVDSDIHPGLAGLWSGLLQEQSVGVIIARGADDMLQFYKKGRHGYYADGDAVELEDWSLLKAFDSTSWATVAKIYLRF